MQDIPKFKGWLQDNGMHHVLWSNIWGNEHFSIIPLRWKLWSRFAFFFMVAVFKILIYSWVPLPCNCMMHRSHKAFTPLQNCNSPTKFNCMATLYVHVNKIYKLSTVFNDLFMLVGILYISMFFIEGCN